MNNITRNKWQVRLAAFVIFALGFAAGALALNAYRAWTRAEGRGGGGRGGRGGFERVIERLDLTAEQRTQVRQILDDARAEMGTVRRESEPRFKEIRRRSDERLRQVLTPEQWQQFQQLKEEMRGRRRGRGRGEGGPPRPREP
jgi:Spy/CpxP family protein refolding chaperone